MKCKFLCLTSSDHVFHHIRDHPVRGKYEYSDI